MKNNTDNTFMCVAGQVIVLTNVINHALMQMSDHIQGNLDGTDENKTMHELVERVGVANNILADLVIARTTKEGGATVISQEIHRKVKPPKKEMQL